MSYTRIRRYNDCRKVLFNENDKIFCLSLHYNVAISYLFVNGTGTIKFKAKYSEIVSIPLCLGNILKEVLSIICNRLD